jgi:protein-disulfide isomerase
MASQWKTALAGGVLGAVAAVAIVFGAATFGIFPPPSNKQFETYLLAHPSIVFQMSALAQTQQADADDHKRQMAVDKMGLATFFDPKIAFVSGPAGARNSVVEFFDYNCAHCRNTLPVVKKFYDAHRGDTRFAFIEFPIFGEASENAARSALAARLQPDKYMAFHFALMGSKGQVDTDQIVAAANQVGIDMNKLAADLKDPGVEKAMKTSHALAQRVGIDGTPAFIVNGKVHEGEITEADLKQLTKR